MSQAVPLKIIFDACASAITKAEKTYTSWSGGITMRAAPESLVQIKLAEEISKKGVRVLLEYGVRQFMEESNGKSPNLEKIPRSSLGRFDLVVFYERGDPRCVIEVKKIHGTLPVKHDHDRIQKILKSCPNVQCGIIVAYGTSANELTVSSRLNNAKLLRGTKLVRIIEPFLVTGKTGRSRFLAAGIFKVERA